MLREPLSSQPLPCAAALYAASAARVSVCRCCALVAVLLGHCVWHAVSDRFVQLVVLLGHCVVVMLWNAADRQVSLRSSQVAPATTILSVAWMVKATAVSGSSNWAVPSTVSVRALVTGYPQQCP